MLQIMNKMKRRQKPKSLLKKTMTYLECETQQELADILGCTQALVSFMFSSNYVSRKMRVTIEEKTNGFIKRKMWLI